MTWPLIDAEMAGRAATDEFNVTAVRVAANRSGLQATKDSDGTWRSSRQWVEEYAQSRYERQG